jgi:hypothetical protein
MATLASIGIDRPLTTGNESPHSAVSWAAVFSGAFVALAASLVLVSLGAGLGLTSISPWPNSGASATTFTISAGIGLIVVQWLSSAMGGYITGRLRTKWVGVHTHEVFFRDTAHGLLSWALASVAGTILLTAAASSVIGGSVQGAATMAGGAAQAAASRVSGYDVDTLFRSDRPDPAAGTRDVAAEATRILATGISNGDVPPADSSYLTQLVAARTGIPQAEAQKRVDDVLARAKAAETKARQVADAARKSVARFAIFTALSMLIGAFVACAAAAYGGGLRDEY